MKNNNFVGGRGGGRTSGQHKELKSIRKKKVKKATTYQRAPQNQKQQ